jgi:hypothetical protein
MLNMHFYGVFRKIELGSNQLVGETEFQRRQHMMFAGREIDNRLLGRDPGGALAVLDSG